MNLARLIVMGIAILTAGMAAFLVRSMSTSQGPANAALEPQVVVVDTTGVLVASRNITVGETMVANDFRWQTWPKEAVHESYIIQVSDTDVSKNWIGAVLRSPVVVGEPLTGHKMVRIGKGGVMAAIIQPGMRGVGVKISAETGAGGFILPNDRVDVITTYKSRADGERSGNFTGETILQDVRVLAIDQTFREEDGQQVVVGRTATLELSSVQSEDLILAAQMGEVSLVLRSLAGEGAGDGHVAVSRKSKNQVVVVRNGRVSGSR